MKTPRRIVIYRIGQLGDTIIALPSFWAIRRQFPDAHLALLSDAHADGKLMLARNVLPEQGLFDEWLSYPASMSGVNGFKLADCLMSLRRGRFDTLVYLAPCSRTPQQVRRDLLFFRAAGIRQFIGHEGFAPLPGPMNGALPFLEHEADHLLGRLRRSGIPVPERGHGDLHLALTPREQEHADAWLAGNGLLDGRTLVGIGPGTKWASKCWAEENFAALGRALLQHHEIHPVVFGGPEDVPLGKRLVEAWGRGSVAAGALSVRVAAAALKRCVLYIGNDTGTMHLAAAVGTRCVGIFSAIDWPGRWYPYGAGHTVMRHAVPCEGCWSPDCTTGTFECIRAIDVEPVLRACEQQLSLGNRAASSAGAVAPASPISTLY